MVKEIKVDCQSICMVDDVTTPNEDVIAVSEKDLLTRCDGKSCSLSAEDQVRGEGMEPHEEAKRCMKERFVERLKIDGGILCLWGE